MQSTEPPLQPPKCNIPVSPKQSFADKVVEKGTLVAWAQLRDYKTEWNQKFEVNEELVRACLQSNGKIEKQRNDNNSDPQWKVHLQDRFYRLDYPSLRPFHFFNNLADISLVNNRKVTKSTLRFKNDTLLDSASCKFDDILACGKELQVYADCGDLFRSFLAVLEEKIGERKNMNDVHFNPFKCFDLHFVSTIIFNYLQDLLPLLATITAAKHVKTKVLTFVLDATVDYSDPTDANPVRDACMKRRYTTGNPLDTIVQSVIVCILNNLVDSNKDYLHQPSEMANKVKKKLSHQNSNFIRCSSFKDIFISILKSSNFVELASEGSIQVKVVSAEDGVPEADLLILKMVNQDQDENKSHVIISGDYDYLLMPFFSDGVFLVNSRFSSVKAINLKLYKDIMVLDILGETNNGQIAAFHSNQHCLFHWYQLFYFVQLLMGSDYSLINFGYGEKRTKMMTTLVQVCLDYIGKNKLLEEMNSETFMVSERILTAELVRNIVSSLHKRNLRSFLSVEVVRFCRIFEFLESMLGTSSSTNVNVPTVVEVTQPNSNINNNTSVTSDMKFLQQSIQRNIKFLNLDIVNSISSPVCPKNSAVKIIELVEKVFSILLGNLHVQLEVNNVGNDIHTVNVSVDHGDRSNNQNSRNRFENLEDELVSSETGIQDVNIESIIETGIDLKVLDLGISDGSSSTGQVVPPDESKRKVRSASPTPSGNNLKGRSKRRRKNINAPDVTSGHADGKGCKQRSAAVCSKLAAVKQLNSSIPDEIACLEIPLHLDRVNKCSTKEYNIRKVNEVRLSVICDCCK